MGGGGEKYGPHWDEARKAVAEGGFNFAFFGARDHYMKSGVVNIAKWEELKPDLLIGESLGSIQTLRVRGIPHLFVSPALGAPDHLVKLAWICRIPGGKAVLHRIWRVKEGDRQPLRFEYDILKKYGPHWDEARNTAPIGTRRGKPWRKEASTSHSSEPGTIT